MWALSVYNLLELQTTVVAIRSANKYGQPASPIPPAGMTCSLWYCVLNVGAGVLWGAGTSAVLSSPLFFNALLMHLIIQETVNVS